MSTTIHTIETHCECDHDIREVVADFFINQPNEEQVIIQNYDDRAHVYSIYHPKIVDLINRELQILHFGGMLQ